MSERLRRNWKLIVAAIILGWPLVLGDLQFVVTVLVAVGLPSLVFGLLVGLITVMPRTLRHFVQPRKDSSIIIVTLLAMLITYVVLIELWVQLTLVFYSFSGVADDFSGGGSYGQPIPTGTADELRQRAILPPLHESICFSDLPEVCETVDFIIAETIEAPLYLLLISYSIAAGLMASWAYGLVWRIRSRERKKHDKLEHS